MSELTDAEIREAVAEVLGCKVGLRQHCLYRIVELDTYIAHRDPLTSLDTCAAALREMAPLRAGLAIHLDVEAMLRSPRTLAAAIAEALEE